MPDSEQACEWDYYDDAEYGLAPWCRVHREWGWYAGDHGNPT